MTPVASWCPADYYRASRAARAAWERTDRQLVIGLDEAAAGTTPSVAAVSSSPSGRSGGRGEPVSDAGRETSLSPRSYPPAASPSSPADADAHGEPPWNGEGGLDNTPRQEN